MAFYNAHQIKKSLFPGYMSVTDITALRNYLTNDIADFFFDVEPLSRLSGDVTVD